MLLLTFFKRIKSKYLKLLAICAVMFCNQTFAQTSQEARVYYLDVTGSMKPIWKTVTDNLKKAIDNISDETTSLEVVAWTDSNHPLSRRKETATSSGKQSLKQFIDNLQLEYNCHTEIFVPFNDFYKNYSNSSKETYFYLMTDGANYSKTRSKLDAAICSWNNKTKSSCYGFYVMLSPEAVAKDIETEIANQNAQLWTVATADVNINHIKLTRCPIFTVRNSQFFDVNIDGELGSGNITLSSSDHLFSISRQEIMTSETGGKFVRVYVNTLSTNLPQEYNWSITVNASKLPQFTFLLTKSLSVKCINKPYPTMKFYFKD